MPDDQAPGTALHLTISARSSEADILVVFGTNWGGGRFGMCMGCMPHGSMHGMMPVINSSSLFRPAMYVGGTCMAHMPWGSKSVTDNQSHLSSGSSKKNPISHPSSSF